ncbi:ComEC/Rec2 family competence protein [Nonomuraea sediminis]|uniref:ComEC/Rec2 family competence protein n=1 Tax=Nonomuraea sediminis TaxID=2835864 RepID=UPI001BDCCBB0|nr:ComEC/Rec2 family competence protein [Nonomuraea sediminis]
MGWRYVVVGLLGCMAATAGVVGFQMYAVTTGPVAELAKRGSQVTAEIVLTDDPKVRASKGGRFKQERVVVPADVEVIETGSVRLAVRTPVIVFASGHEWPGLLPSQRLRVTGRLARPDAGELVGGILLMHGQPRRLGGLSWVQTVAGSFREGLREASNVLPADQRGLLPGLVVGDVSRMDPHVSADLKEVGLSHLNAVSGANLAIVAGAVIALSRLAGVPLAWRAVLAAAAMIAFTVIARPSPSVLRALLMGLIAATALGTGRAKDGLAALSAAVLLLILFDPELARSYGFALSVAATAGILLLAPRWRSHLTPHHPAALPRGSAISPDRPAAPPRSSAVAPRGSATSRYHPAVPPSGSAISPPGPGEPSPGSAVSPRGSAVQPRGSVTSRYHPTVPPPDSVTSPRGSGGPSRGSAISAHHSAVPPHGSTASPHGSTAPHYRNPAAQAGSVPETVDLASCSPRQKLHGLRHLLGGPSRRAGSRQSSPPGSAGRWVWRWVGEAVAVSAAAEVAVTPVLVLMSGQITLVAVPANLLAEPAVAPATLLGFLAALVAPVWPEGARLLVVPAGYAVGWIIEVARWAVGMPLASVPWPGGWVGLVLLGVAVAVAIAVWRRRAWRAVVLTVAGAALVAVLAVRPVLAPWPPEGWLMVVCDVGQGDGLVLAAGEGRAVVVDTGPDPDVMDKCLRRLGVRDVPLVVLTHPHADHVDGLPGVVRGRRVGAVVVSPRRTAPQESGRIVAELGQWHVPEWVASPGMHWVFGPCELTVLAPDPGAGEMGGQGEGSVINNSSVVMRARWRAGSVLLGGDVETEAQAEILRRVSPAADILKVPHHN